LPFNPYWHLPEYARAEYSFKKLYSVNDKEPFQLFLQQLPQNLGARIAFVGLIITRLHILRASREWGPNENRAAEFLKNVLKINGLLDGYKQTINKIFINRHSNEKNVLKINDLSDVYKQTISKILINRHPLLQLNSKVDNSSLLMKSVIAHVIALHASMPPEASPLATLFHKLDECQSIFIPACISDIEAVLLSAVVASGGQVTRYSCECGYKYLIAHCGQAIEATRCPDCKTRTIGGGNFITAAGNRRLDAKPIRGPIDSNDQAGYIGELTNQTMMHSVRFMAPISYRILHLFVHVLISGSSPAVTNNFLQKNNQVADNAEQYCMDHIQNDWNVLKEILNCNDENLALLLHSILSLMTQNPPPASALKTPAERKEWETNFTRNYVSPQTKNVTETIANFRTILDTASAAQGYGSGIIESL
ncbi:17589_t:CDS:2, partial [Acaulospora morrowiae]